MTWLAIVLLLLGSFVFSGIEAGILSVNRVRLRHRVKTRDRAAMRLRELLTSPERFLVTVLVVTNLMNIGAIVLTTQTLVRHLGDRGYLVALAIFLPVNVFLLEMLPKSIFRRFPYRALATLAEPLRFADFLLSPMHFIGWRITRLLVGKTPAAQTKLFVAREDFKYFTAESERTGALSSTERKMIHNVIDFRAVSARDVMVPLERVQTTTPGVLVHDLLGRSVSTGHWRWPVRDEKGEISGLIDAFDLALGDVRSDRIEPHLRRLVRIAPNEPGYAVLRKLRAARATLAAVTEQGGAIIGVVTEDDLVRRLVDTAARG